MIKFDKDYFQKIEFSQKQLEQFLDSAKRDLIIAKQSDVPEVVFKFAYDALLKLGIYVIAKRGYKVKARSGHHVKILEKLAQILKNDDVFVLGNKMRQDRNLGLYSGGSPATEKESDEYLTFVEKVFSDILDKGVL